MGRSPTPWSKASSNDIDYPLSVNEVIKKYLVDGYSSRTHLLINKQRIIASLFVKKFRRRKAKRTLIAAIAASSIALSAAALAQSATAASSAAAGYPSPYGSDKRPLGLRPAPWLWPLRPAPLMHLTAVRWHGFGGPP